MSGAPAAWLLWPMLAQVGWTLMLYVWLTLARLKAVRDGQAEMSCFELGREEPPRVARITRNLANQFELPVIFYALVVLLAALDRVTWLDVAAAWAFVAGRVIHTGVQTLSGDVPLRGRVFMINFLALCGLAAHALVIAAGA